MWALCGGGVGFTAEIAGSNLTGNLFSKKIMPQKAPWQSTPPPPPTNPKNWGGPLGGAGGGAPKGVFFFFPNIKVFGF